MQEYFINRLSKEHSPYLLEHAHDPVDWYPWGEEAFQKAKKENKPIFLSIGYSTCHWCHVMQHESFQDSEIAQMMNNAFVSVKVDREERPDIDSIYMKFCQAMTGRGGWPLTIIMTPDKKPFIAATYIPKDNRFGVTGMHELIPKIELMWKTQKHELEGSADSVVNSIEVMSRIKNKAIINPEIFELVYQELEAQFDDAYGGFGVEPKFPRPIYLNFLLRYWKRSGNSKALSMVEKTLTNIRNGGIFDQIGFGVHRYSVDQEWLEPHFEKMLYDQALLSKVYLETYQATHTLEYSQAAAQLLDFVLRDMRSYDGMFYTAIDADSEGVEGKFYLWSLDEVKKQLSEDELFIATEYFGISTNSTYANKSSQLTENIVYITKSPDAIAKELKINESEAILRIEKVRERLFKIRERKIHPNVDNKILTDMNGLMISSLALGHRIIGDERYKDAAIKAADFIMNKIFDGKKLYHSYSNNHGAIEGFLNDYAYLANGLIELYQATFEDKYLEYAINIANMMLSEFWDKKSHGFYINSNDSESMIVREKQSDDGVCPSGNSIAMLILIKLYRMIADTKFEKIADMLLESMSGEIIESPSAHMQFLIDLDFAFGPSYEVVIAGDRNDERTVEIINGLDAKFIPNMVVLFKTDLISELADFTKDMKSKNNQPIVYVCDNHSCKNPTNKLNKILELLDSKA